MTFDQINKLKKQHKFDSSTIKQFQNSTRLEEDDIFPIYLYTTNYHEQLNKFLRATNENPEKEE